MPFTIEWDNKEKGIIFTALDDPWTWGDFIDSHKKAGEMAQSVDYDVYLIADMRMTLKRPMGGFKQKREAISHLPENIRANIFIGFPNQEGRLDITIGRFFTHLIGIKMEMHVVEGMEAAYQLIEELRNR